MVTKYPLLRPAIAISVGIIVARWLPVVWQAGFAFAASLAVLAWVSKKYRQSVTLGLWFVLGASLLSFRYDTRQSTDVRLLFTGEPELVRISGVLSDDPERRILERDGETRYRTTARVSLHQVEPSGRARYNATGEIAISTTGFLPEHYVAGTQIEVFGVMSRPQGPMAPGLFDFEEYLKWQRIFFLLRADTTNDWKIVRQAEGWNVAAIYRAFNNWARRTLQRGIPEDENTRLLWAMVLGWKPGLTNEISEPFMRTGTLHVFAISGLHIAMIAGILVGFQRGMWFPDFFVNAWIRFFPEVNLGLSRTVAGAITIPVIWFYTAATGWQASAIRSTIMCSVIILGWMLRRPNNILNSISVAALLILVWQPEQLFQVGFQLSFILLLTIALWPGMTNPPWSNPEQVLGEEEVEEFERKPEINVWTRGWAIIYRKLSGRDSLLPADLRPDWRRFLDGPIKWALGGANLSIAALIGSLPVTALYFNLVSLSSLVANLIVVPVSGIALGSSLASLLLAPLPLLPELANMLSWCAMWFMVWFCRELEGIRPSYHYVQAPDPYVIIAYYVAIIALVKGWLRIRSVAFGVGALTVVCLSSMFWKESTQTKVTVLPGAGVVYAMRRGPKMMC